MRSPEPILDERALTGRSRSHVIESTDPPCTLHPEVMSAFLAMREAARSADIDLQAASSFRDFDRQLAIWNGKFRGERPMVDRTGRSLDANALTPAERVEAILIWSALPGASRHHWGTDLDVFDATKMPERARLQLVPEEYAKEGPFATLTRWLDEHMHRFGFFRPYVAAEQGRPSSGVNPEPWHLSYAPLSIRFMNALSVDVLSRAIEESPLEGRDIVLASIGEFHRRFIVSVADPPDSLATKFGEYGRMV